jgi:hypothetical protein
MRLSRFLISTALVATIFQVPPEALAVEQGPEVCARYAHQAGFRGNDLVEAIAIGMGESDCRTYFNDPDPQDQGMWQIQVNSTDPWRNGTYGDLKDPAFNARATYAISRGGTNWQAWSTYTNPSSPRYYGNYLSRAARAASVYSAARFAADFDGSGARDLAVYREGDHSFHIQHSDGRYDVRSWGIAGDVPVAGDFDGKGVSNLVVYRPSDYTWHIKRNDGSYDVRSWGVAGDVPVAGDWDGDGISDLTTFRPSNNSWHIRLGNGSYVVKSWGIPGDVPVAGDFTGDGVSDLVVYRPSNHTWHIRSHDSDYTVKDWGVDGDVPVAGDFDGDGVSDLAIYRPSDRTWHIKLGNGSYVVKNWGVPGDMGI